MIATCARKLVAGAVAAVLYFVLSQVVFIAFLFLATWRGWDLPWYHEPAEYHWWRWLLFALWCAGFVAFVWWASSRFGNRSRESRADRLGTR